MVQNNRRDVRAAEGARLEIVCMPSKVYRGFESPSLRQLENVFVAELLRGWPKVAFPNFYILILFDQFDFT